MPKTTLVAVLSQLALTGLEITKQKGINSVGDIEGAFETQEERNDAYRAITELYFEERLLRKERQAEYNSRPDVVVKRNTYMAKRNATLKEAMKLLKAQQEKAARAKEIGNVTTVAQVDGNGNGEVDGDEDNADL